LNGISGITQRPDLLDRAIYISLPSMSLKERKTEQELKAHFNLLLPRLLDVIFKSMSAALKNYDSIVAPKDIRMSDAAKWLMAAEPALGIKEGALIKSLKASQNEVIAETMGSNSVATALRYLLDNKGVFSGTVGQLLECLHAECEINKYDRYFPATASHLSKTLARLAPALKVINIVVEFGPKQNKGRTIFIWDLEDGDFETSKDNRGQIVLEFPAIGI
jgi:hypothetical protein